MSGSAPSLGSNAHTPETEEYRLKQTLHTQNVLAFGPEMMDIYASTPTVNWNGRYWHFGRGLPSSQTFMMLGIVASLGVYLAKATAFLVTGSCLAALSALSILFILSRKMGENKLEKAVEHILGGRAQLEILPTLSWKIEKQSPSSPDISLNLSNVKYDVMKLVDSQGKIIAVLFKYIMTTKNNRIGTAVDLYDFEGQFKHLNLEISKTNLFVPQRFPDTCPMHRIYQIMPGSSGQRLEDLFKHNKPHREYSHWV